MKRSALAFVILSILLSAIAARAEYGTWEDLYGFDPPGYSNASFLGVSVADYDNLYTVGMQQPNYDRIVYGWSSHNGGVSWDETVVMNYDGSICDMMKMFTFIIGVAGVDQDSAAYGGFGTSEDCYETLPEPWCMFICMLTLKPVIYYTVDGGATVQQADTPFIFGGAVVAMDQVDGVYYAVGGDDLILKSDDKGQTWQSVETLPGQGMSYGGVDFITENVGFVTVGEAEPEPERGAGMSDQDWARAMYDHRVAQVRWLHDPAYRAERRAQWAAHGHPGGKGIKGRIFKTTDGGATWERLIYSEDEAFGQIQMLSEQEGWVWSSPVTGTYPDFKLYRTTDGGETWVDYTDRIPLDDLGGIAYGMMAFGFNPSGATGFLVGAGQGAINFKSVLFYTIDRGETWHLDKTLLDWGHPLVSIGWAGEKVAYQAGADLSTYRYTQLNTAPIADAGEDQEVAAGTVTLDGAGSYDPDGDAITYEWSQIAGPAAELSGADTVSPTFTANAVGDYEFRLVVSDGQETGHDEVAITITEAADDDAVDDDAVDDDDDDDDNDDSSGGGASAGDDDDDSDGCGC